MSVAGTEAPQEIVVGLNKSQAAAAALGWAAEQSRLTGVPLRIVYAWQMTASQVASANASFWAASAADARARATRWVQATLADRADQVRWVLDVDEGPPGPLLVGRSRDAALLVLGTGEHVGMRRLVAGSVSHYVLSHASPPVVAVRAAPAPPTPTTAASVAAESSAAESSAAESIAALSTTT